MNILIDKLPTEIDGIIINSNFRNMILFDVCLYDNNLPLEQQLLTGIELLFKDSFPNDPFNKLIWFYNGGEISKQEESSNIRERSHCYEKDADLIYAAFLAQYNIDLQDIEYLHWWKFKALFRGLNAEHEISQRIQLRLSNPKDLTPEQRKIRQDILLDGNKKMTLKERDEKMLGYVESRFGKVRNN